jgi:cysteine-rich repeat protein
VTCDDDCTLASCGDGTINLTALETCDDSGESLTCDVDCTAAVCGDFVTNTTAGEECDDGNTVPGDGCDALCVVE